MSSSENGGESDGGSDSGSDERDASSRVGSGMGAAMSKILGRDAVGRDPVLAKRVTPMMKELEATKKRPKPKKAEKEDLGMTPGAILKEKAMRKTATRAVVALFNAIAGHQRPSESLVLEENDRPSKRKKARKGKNEEEVVATGALDNDWAQKDYLLDAE